MGPFQLLIKPASAGCNLNCDYCFYCDEGRKRETFSYGFMTDEVLECLVKKAFDYGEGFCGFAFQGGEPTLAGLDFYKKFAAFQKKYNKKNLKVFNSIQTNGYELSDEWAKFFAEEKFLVGLSLDGVIATHNAYRKNKNGENTFSQVMKTAEMFCRFQVEYNILTVVHARTAMQPEKIYDFYKKNGFRYLQFIACLDPMGEEGGRHEYSLTPEAYGRFLCGIFERWFQDVQKGEQPYIRQFENIVSILAGYPPESCEQRGSCTVQNVVEADGSVYPCDFYALDDYRLGNIMTDDFGDMAQAPAGKKFVEESKEIMEDCRGCRFFAVCRGGCRRNRFQEGGKQKNYFCPGYRLFYENSIDRFRFLAQRLR